MHVVHVVQLLYHAAIYPSVKTIAAAGDRSVVIHIDPKHVPSKIDVSGMTSWGLPAFPERAPTNTRVIIHLSQWQQDALASPLTVAGALQYQVPDGAHGVVVKGCGVQGKVDCTATDSKGVPTCRVVDACVPDAATAKDTTMSVVNGATPCAPPL